MELQVNLWAVLAAAVASMIVGAVWYAKPVFGTIWAKLVGINLDDAKTKKEAPKALVIAFLMSLLMAYVLAHVAALSNWFYGVGPLASGLSTAFWLWLGIAMTRTVTHDAFEGRRKKLTLINISNQLVTLMAMGLVIGLFGGY